MYLKVFAGIAPDISASAERGRIALFGILFFDKGRKGPQCVGACVSWGREGTVRDHWVLLSALGCSGQEQNAFKRTPGPVSVAKPVKRARDKWSGVDSVEWFEVPLGAISSADVPAEVVRATQALVEQDDEPAKKLVLRSLEGW